jgi:outer membrane protein assembly factor BamB
VNKALRGFVLLFILIFLVYNLTTVNRIEKVCPQVEDYFETPLDTGETLVASDPAEGSSLGESQPHESQYHDSQLHGLHPHDLHPHESQSQDLLPREPLYSVVSDPESLNSISFQIMDDEQIVESCSQEFDICFENPQKYSEVEGVTCFRGNPYRNSAVYGNVEVQHEKLEIIWSIPIGGIDKWTGIGWNGQPAIVRWPEELKQKMNLVDEKKQKAGLREVIYAALDGNVYFLDLDDGKYTRSPIAIPGPVKGSLTVDPRGIPLLYVGQGINTVHGRWVEMGYRIFSLLDQKKLFFINGSDNFAYRGWPAFDSTAIIDRNSDTMVVGGENGLLYIVKLNTQYDPQTNIISINPRTVKYRYKAAGNNYQGIENSVAVYSNYAYFADNGGSLQCVNLNTLEPVWVRNVTDDTDSTIVLDEEPDERRIALYTACEVDKQGPGGYCYIRKFNALNGELIWERSYRCYATIGEQPINGGAFATPVVGKNEISNLVIYNLARCEGFNRGKLVALDKENSREVWSMSLDHYSWSSPVDIYTMEGKAYIIVSDTAGNMLLLEGKTGKILDRISVQANVEGSPAVFDDMLVVGTRGQKIFGIKIK